MKFFTSLLHKRSLLDEECTRLVNNWKALGKFSLNTPLVETKWVVVDTETSGFDVVEDRLISIGAVSVKGDSLCLDESFNMVIQQETISSTQNILVHGIGNEAQSSGSPHEMALAKFLAYAGRAPMVGFHIPFDAAILRRDLHKQLGISFTPQCLDLATLAPALFPDLDEKLRSLDDWLAHFGIELHARHDALADAFGTAQLFLILLQRSRQQGLVTANQVIKTAQAQQWLTKIKQS